MSKEILVSILTVFVYYVLNAAAGAMLPPEPGKERTFYGWAFRFLQQLAANAHRLLESKVEKISAVADTAHWSHALRNAARAGLVLGSLALIVLCLQLVH